MKQKLLLFLMLCVVLLFSVSCLAPLDEGTITNMNYVPAHEETYRIRHSNGKMSYYTIMHRNIPDKWSITIEDIDASGKYRSEVIEVTESQYESYDIGQKIVLRENK